MSRTIAILTDFGTDDNYVGVMKGIIRSISPDVNIIDITHAIAPQHVRQAAFTLLNTYTYFPPDTIFLVVVDPGVGTERRSVAVQAGGYTFIAPDNGVLSYVLKQLDTFQTISITNPDYRLREISFTFHGRDLFAPASAHLANGISVSEMGEQVNDLMTLPEPELVVKERHMIGEIIHIDHFGNIISSIGTIKWNTEERLTLLPAFNTGQPTVRILAEHAQIKIAEEEIDTIHPTYNKVPRGELVALVGSDGFLEIAVNQGSAKSRLDVMTGDRVELHIGDIDATVRY